MKDCCCEWSPRIPDGTGTTGEAPGHSRSSPSSVPRGELYVKVERREVAVSVKHISLTYHLSLLSWFPLEAVPRLHNRVSAACRIQDKISGGPCS